jgi:hypothetical protein
MAHTRLDNDLSIQKQRLVGEALMHGHAQTQNDVWVLTPGSPRTPQYRNIRYEVPAKSKVGARACRPSAHEIT